MYEKFDKPSVECLCPGGCGNTVVLDWSTAINVLNSQGNVRQQFAGLTTCDQCRVFLDTEASIPVCQFELLFGGEE